MSEFTISLAGKAIEVVSLYSYVEEYCKDYISSQKPDFSIIISQKDIDYEREKSAKENIKESIPVINYSDEYLETLSVYRKVCERLIEDEIILFHGSVIAVDGQGYLFTAKSGTGKSTHTRLWREYLGERAVMINDDKPLLKLTDTGVVVYGTAWDGKHRLSTNTNVPLKAICILERAEENHIDKITAKLAYNMLVQQIYKPKNPSKLMKTLELIDKLTDKISLYRLGCNMDISSAQTAYEMMKG